MRKTPQTYNSYYKDYFKSDSGKKSVQSSKQRYFAKLRESYPGVGLNKAARMRSHDRKKQQLITEGGES